MNKANREFIKQQILAGPDCPAKRFLQQWLEGRAEQAGQVDEYPPAVIPPRTVTEAPVPPSPGPSPFRRDDPELPWDARQDDPPADDEPWEFG